MLKEAPRGFSWVPKYAIEETAPRDVYRKRKSCRPSPSDRAARETMTGVQEDRISPFSADEKEQDCRGMDMLTAAKRQKHPIHLTDIKFSLTLLCSRYSDKLVFIFNSN